MYLITEDGSFAPPSESYCTTITNQYGLTMPVLRDPTGTTVMTALGVAANRDADFVMNAGLTIVQKVQGNGNGAGGTITDETIRPTIDALLGGSGGD